MERRFDFLVIGSGIAGLFYALQVVTRKPDARIAIVTKKSAIESNTNRAQGGIAAVLSNTDSFDAHIMDTLRAGCDLCDPEVVRQVVEAGPGVITELINYGVKFSEKAGQFDLTREGGHSANRVVHAEDLTGREIEMALLKACRALSPRIEIYRNSIAVDLITSRMYGETICSGAWVLLEGEQTLQTFLAPVTMLATGGLCQVYLHNTNPLIATGDGVVMAHRAGVTVSNLEFVQFHPTALYTPRDQTFLISEAVRGEGGRLRSVDGRYIMDDIHELKDLAPRDIVARAIDKELKSTGAEFVLLDISHKEASFLRSRFPNIYAECQRRGYDITKEPIPVVPSAHYACGGVKCDISGETELPGLYVAGEVAMTGMHGANRLASNSLLEAVVISKNAAERTIGFHKEVSSSNEREVLPFPESGRHKADVEKEMNEARLKLKKVMSDLVGIVRSEERLRRAQRKIKAIRKGVDAYSHSCRPDYALVEMRNLVTVSELITEMALKRKESRGLHFMEEYQQTSNKFAHNSEVTKIEGPRRALA